MKRKNTLIHFGFALILVFLQACNLPGGAPDGTPTVDPLEAAALTVTAAALQADATATFTALPELTGHTGINCHPCFHIHAFVCVCKPL
jgi:hypothetical protein